jgi:hypothetical protein
MFPEGFPTSGNDKTGKKVDPMQSIGQQFD